MKAYVLPTLYMYLERYLLLHNPYIWFGFVFAKALLKKKKEFALKIHNIVKNVIWW